MDLNKKSHRLEWVDSLRGISALLVVILHLWFALISQYKIETLKPVAILSYVVFDYTDFGKIGVVCFFLISGFVIPYSFRGKTNKLFFFNRFFRLYPAYWIAILSSVIIVGISSLKIVLINLTMFQRFVGTPDLIGAFWTLQIEIIFYVICAVVHYYGLLEKDKFIVKLTYLFIGLSLVVAAARYFTNLKLPVALFLALGVMFLGLCWRKYSIDNSPYINKTLIRKLIIIFIIVLLPVCLLAYSRDYGFGETWYRYFFSYITALGLFYIFSIYKFVNRFLLFLGNISYSLYLLHAVFGLELSLIIVRKYNIHNIFLYIVIFFTLSILSATICYNLVEKPAVKLGKKIIGRMKTKNVN